MCPPPPYEADDDGHDSPLTFPRRVFIQRLTFFGGGVILLGSACKKAPAPDASPAKNAVPSTSHRSLTNDEYAVMTAAVDRVLPKDEDPGAVEAGVPEYIDRMLLSPELFQMRQDFTDGLNHLEKRSRDTYQSSFARITSAQQDTLLVAFKDAGSSSGEAHFYELLVTLTLEGFLGDPSYGGNKDHVGWTLVGFGTSEPPPSYDGQKHLHHMKGM